MPECSYCEQTFSDDEDLTTHLASEHDWEQLSRIDKKRIEKIRPDQSPDASYIQKIKHRIGIETPTSVNRRSFLHLGLASVLGIGIGAGGMRQFGTTTPSVEPDPQSGSGIIVSKEDDAVVTSGLASYRADTAGELFAQMFDDFQDQQLNVVIREGTYEVDYFQWQMYGGHSIQGMGPGLTTLRLRDDATDNTDDDEHGVISATGEEGSRIEDVSIRDLTVDGNRENNSFDTGEGAEGIELEYVNRAWIHNVHVKSAVGDGIDIDFCDEIFCRDYLTKDNGKSGVILSRGCVDQVFDSGIVKENCQIFSTRSGFDIPDRSGDDTNENIVVSSLVARNNDQPGNVNFNGENVSTSGIVTE